MQPSPPLSMTIHLWNISLCWRSTKLKREKWKYNQKQTVALSTWAIAELNSNSFLLQRRHGLTLVPRKVLNCSEARIFMDSTILFTISKKSVPLPLPLVYTVPLSRQLIPVLTLKIPNTGISFPYTNRDFASQETINRKGYQSTSSKSGHIRQLPNRLMSSFIILLRNVRGQYTLIKM